MDVFRIFDALNDIRNLKTAIQATKEAGKHAQRYLLHTSPVHKHKRVLLLSVKDWQLWLRTRCNQGHGGVATPT